MRKKKEIENSNEKKTNTTSANEKKSINTDEKRNKSDREIIRSNNKKKIQKKQYLKLY